MVIGTDFIGSYKSNYHLVYACRVSLYNEKYILYFLQVNILFQHDQTFQQESNWHYLFTHEWLPETIYF